MKTQLEFLYYIYFLIISLTFYYETINAQTLNKFTITENDLFDKIMSNNENMIKKINNDKNQLKTLKKDSILLNENIKIVRNEIDLGKKLSNEFKILYGHDNMMWILNNETVFSINNSKSNYSLQVTDYFSSPYNKQHVSIFKFL